MKAFQGKIKINNGKIADYYYSPGCVELCYNDRKSLSIQGFALPGFIDSHCHLFGLGVKLNEIDLNGCQSESECIQLLHNAKARGAWIIARGWNQDIWENKKLPNKESLDLHFPSDPVYLIRSDGHAAWVNSKTLELSKIDSDTSNPNGGSILKDEQSNPTGILVDNAMNLVQTLLPPYQKEDLRKYLLDAVVECHRNGLCGIHDMDTYPQIADLLIELSSNKNLHIKIDSYLQAQNNEWKQLDFSFRKFENLRFKGLKYYSDGALGSWGAYLLSSYADNPGNNGLKLISSQELINNIEENINSNFDYAVHAIGDAANREVLDAYCFIKEKYPYFSNELRIEHVQILHPEDIQRMAKYNITASVQPIHYQSDYFMAQLKLNESTLEYSYPLKSLLNNGIKLIAGSDFPVESHSPLKGIKAAISRKQGFNKINEAITIEEAVNSYCYTPRGLKLSVDSIFQHNYDADLVILNRDIFNTPMDEFDEIRVVATIIKGDIVFMN